MSSNTVGSSLPTAALAVWLLDTVKFFFLSAMGVYMPYLGVTMKTSSLDGKFDFGIGKKSFWSVELSGRKWEDGCSNRGFFFRHSLGFFVDGFLVMAEVGA